MKWLVENDEGESKTLEAKTAPAALLQQDPRDRASNQAMASTTPSEGGT